MHHTGTSNLDDSSCWSDFFNSQILLAYTLSTKFLNQIGRNINTYNPTEPVTGIIGISIKRMRTKAHLILAEKEPFIILLFRGIWFLII